MAKQATPAVRPGPTVRGDHLLEPPGSMLKAVAGSEHPDFNNVLINAVAQAVWIRNGVTEEERSQRAAAALAAVKGFAPRDEVEGMLAAQAVALHHAAMECLRRAMIPDQPSEGSDRLRRQAANLSRAMVDMVDAIERRRGKGPQVVRVERVVVQDGGRAIVGAVTATGGAGGGADAG